MTSMTPDQATALLVVGTILIILAAGELLLNLIIRTLRATGFANLRDSYDPRPQLWVNEKNEWTTRPGSQRKAWWRAFWSKFWE